MKLPHRRQFLHFAAGAAALPAVSRVAMAQAYPNRPITMIVPFAPGGISDVMGRMMAEPMRAVLGQPIVIENVSGAGGTIGVGRAVRSAADGYTLSIGTIGSHVLSGALYTLSWDLLRDLQPIAPLVNEPLMIVGRKDLPAQDLLEFIAWLKANPNRASQGHAGIGATGHVTGLSFQRETGTSFQSVPYRGGGPALQDLLAGHIDFEIEPVSNFLEQVHAGNLKALAITGKARLSAAAPNIPTVDDAGLPGFHRSAWVGLWMPKGAATDVVAKLGAAVQTVMANQNLRARIAALGQETFPPHLQTPDGLATFQKAEMERWWPIIKAAGIRAE
jgi:tripartite-type tricarboxylate transporter receptor subunit TctC